MRNSLIAILVLICSLASAQEVVITATNDMVLVTGDPINGSNYLEVALSPGQTMYASRTVTAKGTNETDAMEHVFESWAVDPQSGAVTSGVQHEVFLQIGNNENQAQSALDDLNALLSPDVILTMIPKPSDTNEAVIVSIMAAPTDWAVPYLPTLVDKAPPGQLKTKVKADHDKKVAQGKSKTPGWMKDNGWKKPKPKKPKKNE